MSGGEELRPVSCSRDHMTRAAKPALTPQVLFVCEHGNVKSLMARHARGSRGANQKRAFRATANVRGSLKVQRSTVPPVTGLRNPKAASFGCANLVPHISSSVRF